jgi:MerR family transcriptional regulator, light-induced transcriptional regulator
MRPDPELGAALEQASGELATRLTDRHFARRPELVARFGPAGRAKCAEDARFHLRYLAQALVLGVPGVFADYLAWAVPMLASRKVPKADLRADMEELHTLLAEHFPHARSSLEAVMLPALAAIDAAAEEVELTPIGAHAQAYFTAVQDEGPVEARRVVSELSDSGMPATQIYVDVLAPAMQRTGELWQANRISVGDEHYFTAVTQRVMARLFSDLVQGRGRGPGVVVSCVATELHELGARMVCDLLELGGYNSHYLGANMPPRAIADFACLRGARVLALSASITPHLAAVREVIGHLRADPRCAHIKVLVGGRAFNGSPSLWQATGADGWAQDAGSAIAEVRRLTS